MRLNSYFPTSNAGGPQRNNVVLVPPCGSLSYFLNRIVAISNRPPSAQPTDITHPKNFNPNTDGNAGGEALGLCDLAFLIWTRDFLAALTLPATLDTIRVTTAYREGRTRKRGSKGTAGGNSASSSGGSAKNPVDSRGDIESREVSMREYGLKIAKMIRRFQLASAVLIWITIYMSGMVYSGQVLLSETVSQQKSLEDLRNQMGIAIAQNVEVASSSNGEPNSDTNADLSIRDCYLNALRGNESRGDRSNSPLLMAFFGWLTGGDESHGDQSNSSRSQTRRGLCEEGRILAQRTRELSDIEHNWFLAARPLISIAVPSVLPSDVGNALQKFAGLAPQTLRERTDANAATSTSDQNQSGAGTAGGSAPSSILSLETQKQIIQMTVYGLLGGIMPIVYAVLGALASLFRRLSEKAKGELLGPSDYSGMMISVVLGGLTGAVIGLFVGVEPNNGSGAGLPLTTSAVALLAGYAADRVFLMFDGLAQRVFVGSQEQGAVGAPSQTSGSR
jgi:hypothetical protein